MSVEFTTWSATDPVPLPATCVAVSTVAGVQPGTRGFGRTETTSQRFVPVMTVNGGDIVRPGDIEIRLRPYTDADREVECGAPLMSAAG